MTRNWLASIESYLKRGNAESAMWLLDGVPISELDQATPIMDRYKDVVLKYLLTLINLYGLTDHLVDSTITGIRRTRVDWPEMNTILNSVHAEYERRQDLNNRY